MVGVAVAEQEVGRTQVLLRAQHLPDSVVRAENLAKAHSRSASARAARGDLEVALDVGLVRQTLQASCLEDAADEALRGVDLVDGTLW